mgnify:CR=1 FL=1
MVAWIMILFSYAGPVGVTQIGPFADRAACEFAGNAAKQTSTTPVRFVCVPNSSGGGAGG